MEIRQLQRGDDRNQFDCGSEDLNRFLREFAFQNQEKRASVTFVAVDEGESIVRGYTTVCAGALTCQELPRSLSRGLSRQPQPVMRVARLGVDRDFQRRGIGSRLLVRALRQAIAQAGASGCVGVIVDSKPEASEYYRDKGFIVLEFADEPGSTIPLFAPISMIEDAFTPRAERVNDVAAPYRSFGPHSMPLGEQA